MSKGCCLSLSEEMFSSLCSHFVYVQAGNTAAFPPVAMTGQLRPSPCLSHSLHCSVLTNRLGHAGYVLQPPELCSLASVFRMALRTETAGVPETFVQKLKPEDEGIAQAWLTSALLRALQLATCFQKGWGGGGQPQTIGQGSRVPDKCSSLYELFSILSPVTEIVGTNSEVPTWNQGQTKKAAYC